VRRCSDLAGEYDSVVTILNRALAEALSVELGQEPLRLEPLKPRLTPAESQQQQQQQQQRTDLTSSSLSMLGTDDPVELAQKVLALYDQNSLWWRRVSQMNRDTVGILFQLNNAKKVIEAGDYMAALGVSFSISVFHNHALTNHAANRKPSYPSSICWRQRQRYSRYRQQLQLLPTRDLTQYRQRTSLVHWLLLATS
jgi:nuclear pore complex protein Nup93